MINISDGAINFNKQILFGEIGAMIGAPLFSYTASQFFSSPNTISAITVIGVIITASAFWLTLRIYDKTRNGKIETRKFLEDLAYFTPVAFVISFLVYYPTLFFLSRFLFSNDYRIVSSAIISQMTAFVIFLTSINFYRYFLIRLTGRAL